MPIYGITVHKSGRAKYDVLSTSKSALMKIAAIERKKGYDVVPYQKGFTTLRIEGNCGIQVVK